MIIRSRCGLCIAANRAKYFGQACLAYTPTYTTPSGLRHIKNPRMLFTGRNVIFQSTEHARESRDFCFVFVVSKLSGRKQIKVRPEYQLEDTGMTELRYRWVSVYFCNVYRYCSFWRHLSRFTHESIFKMTM